MLTETLGRLIIYIIFERYGKSKTIFKTNLYILVKQLLSVVLYYGSKKFDYVEIFEFRSSFS